MILMILIMIMMIIVIIMMIGGPCRSEAGSGGSWIPAAF